MEIGIIQGRLSPFNPAKFQTFPSENWQEEFVTAEKIGFDCIEWLLVTENWQSNPIWCAKGITEIKEMTTATNVGVKSLCADYFMDSTLFSSIENERTENISIFRDLIKRCNETDIKTILLPVLEYADIKNEQDKFLLIDSLNQLKKTAEKYSVTIALEMERDAVDYLSLISNLNSNYIQIYYDTGNLAARGNDLVSDCTYLANRIKGVHLKDRQFKGSTVPLGEGAADFERFLSSLKSTNFKGPLILQPYFDENYIYWAKKNFNYIKGLCAKLKY